MARAPRPLDGRVIAITGAARGIGRATAQACVRAGMKVAIGDLDLPEAQRTAAELGYGTIAVELDVCDRASVGRFIDATEEALGPLDVFVNNAGIMPLSPFVDETDAIARMQVDVNVHGVLHGTKEALARMLPRGRGHIVNIASSAARAGMAGGATYSGTKHFVAGVSEGVRAEVRGSGIEVSVVLPVVVRTELAAGVPEPRFISHIDAPTVADAIVAALRRPRFEVYVPRRVGPLSKLGAALPTRMRDGVRRTLALDRVLAGADGAARAGYEVRAAQSNGAAAARASDE